MGTPRGVHPNFPSSKNSLKLLQPSHAKLFGYTLLLVWATVAITILAFVVWLHHFFTMGSGANVNAFGASRP